VRSSNNMYEDNNDIYEDNNDENDDHWSNEGESCHGMS